MGDKEEGSVGPGRPSGYKLSKESIDKIRKHKLGGRLSAKTKEKISSSLTAYFKFKKKHFLADSLKKEYANFSEEVANWIEDHKKDINNTKNVMTKKRLAYVSRVEVNFGHDIDAFSHNTDPEFILLLKESLINDNNKEALKELYSLVL